MSENQIHTNAALYSEDLAPVSADKITAWLTNSLSTNPPAIVFATFCATIAPTKFKTAAIMIAVLGLKTLVDTTVAIAFAVS